MKYCQERINKCLDALGYEKDNNIYRSSIKYNDSGKIELYTGSESQNIIIRNSAIAQGQFGWFKKNILF